MEFSVHGFTSQEVEGVWICEPILVVTAEEGSDEFGGSGVLGELSGRLGKPSSTENLDKLSSAGGKELGGFNNEAVMEKGSGTDLDEAEKSSLRELVLKNVMVTRNDSERLVMTFLVMIIYST